MRLLTPCMLYYMIFKLLGDVFGSGSPNRGVSSEGAYNREV